MGSGCGIRCQRFADRWARKGVYVPMRAAPRMIATNRSSRDWPRGDLVWQKVPKPTFVQTDISKPYLRVDRTRRFPAPFLIADTPIFAPLISRVNCLPHPLLLPGRASFFRSPTSTSLALAKHLCCQTDRLLPTHLPGAASSGERGIIDDFTSFIVPTSLDAGENELKAPAPLTSSLLG